MDQKVRLKIFFFLGGFFLLLDQWLKYQARTDLAFSYYLWRPWIGWEFLANKGIAFSLSIPLSFVLILTPLVIFALTIALIRSLQNNSNLSVCLFGIICGAISNYIDRVCFGFTIDYLRIFTSIFNIGDILIAGGVVGLLLQTTQSKNNVSNLCL